VIVPFVGMTRRSPSLKPGARWKPWARCCTSAAVLLLCGMAGRPPEDIVRLQIYEYQRTLLQYLRAYYLLPIVVPVDQQPGDVYDPKYWLLKSRRMECFPGLTEPEFTKTNLPGLVDVGAGNLGLALGLGNIVSTSASGKMSDKIQILFRDLEVAEVSQTALAVTLDPACDYLKPIVNEREADLSVRKPYIVIGRIVRGKRDIFVGVREGAEANAVAQDIAASLGTIAANPAIKVLAADAKVSVSVGFEGRRGVIVQSEQIQPIAFAPAFIPDLIYDQTRGGPNANNPPVALKWNAFINGDPTSSAQFDRLIERFGVDLP
jgi:hypothetical protein